MTSDSSSQLPVLYVRFLNFTIPALIVLAAAGLITEYSFSEDPDTGYPGAALLTWTNIFFENDVVPGQLVAHRAAVIAQLICSIILYFISPVSWFSSDCILAYYFILLVSTIFGLVNLIYFLNATEDSQRVLAFLYGYEFDEENRVTIFPGVGSLISYIHGGLTLLLFILALLLKTK